MIWSINYQPHVSLRLVTDTTSRTMMSSVFTFLLRFFMWSHMLWPVQSCDVWAAQNKRPECRRRLCNSENKEKVQREQLTQLVLYLCFLSKNAALTSDQDQGLNSPWGGFYHTHLWQETSGPGFSPGLSGKEPGLIQASGLTQDGFKSISSVSGSVRPSHQDDGAH